eukprot:gene15990-biopygen8212
MSLGGGGNFLASPPPQALPPLPGIITTSPQQQQQQQATAAFAAMAAAARAPASRQARMVATSAVRNGGVSPAWGQCICALVSLSFVGAGVGGRARTRGCRFPAWEGDGAGKSIRDGGAHALVPGWSLAGLRTCIMSCLPMTLGRWAWFHGRVAPVVVAPSHPIIAAGAAREKMKGLQRGRRCQEQEHANPPRSVLLCPVLFCPVLSCPVLFCSVLLERSIRDGGGWVHGYVPTQTRVGLCGPLGVENTLRAEIREHPNGPDTVVGKLDQPQVPSDPLRAPSPRAVWGRTRGARYGFARRDTPRTIPEVPDPPPFNRSKLTGPSAVRQAARRPNNAVVDGGGGGGGVEHF